MKQILIDADACPVKGEIYKVAARHGVPVKVVSNSWMRTPTNADITMIVTSNGFDAADDWIAAESDTESIVITSDIPLASRCLEKGARVVDPKGRLFTTASIGEALATRELMSFLRDMGTVSGGPAPFSPQDRSRFLQVLDNLVQGKVKG